MLSIKITITLVIGTIFIIKIQCSDDITKKSMEDNHIIPDVLDVAPKETLEVFHFFIFIFN